LSHKFLASIGEVFYDIGIDMDTVTLSSKFQVVIPQAVRERMKLKPGTRFRVIEIGGCVELIPIRPIEEYKGILKGKLTDTDIEREDDRL
jgi:AbrB family looped-hinge helix DNA binding protein